MFPWSLFPHSDFQKINLDWIMRKLAEIDPQGLSNPVSYDPQSPDAAEQAQARDNLGLGDISVENAPLPIDKGGTGADTVADTLDNFKLLTYDPQTLDPTDVAQARTNLGIGDLASENAPLPIAKGGTGAIDKATAAGNLEVVSWGAAQVLNDTQKEQARDNIDAIAVEDTIELDDSAYSSDFAPYASTYRIRLTRQGNLVCVTGFVKPLSALSAGQHLIFTLPVGYRPDRERYYVMRGSGSDIWFAHITPGGNFEAYIYISTNTGASIAYPSNALIVCDITFPLK